MFIKLTRYLKYMPAIIVCTLYITTGNAAQSFHCEKGSFDEGKIIKWSLGATDAPIKVTMISSLDCSHCKSLHHSVFPSIKKNYIDTGLVLYTSIHIPGSLRSLMMDKIANCYALHGGNTQSKEERYFSILDVLYNIQDSIIHDTNIEGYISQIGVVNKINNPDFESCVLGNDMQDALVASYHMILCRENEGFQGTPEITINGNKFLGYRSYTFMDKEFKKELSIAGKQ